MSQNSIFLKIISVKLLLIGLPDIWLTNLRWVLLWRYKRMCVLYFLTDLRSAPCNFIFDGIFVAEECKKVQSNLDKIPLFFSFTRSSLGDNCQIYLPFLCQKIRPKMLYSTTAPSPTSQLCIRSAFLI